MSLKSFALLDVIGVTDSLRSGRGEEVLETFWNAADAWTLNQNSTMMLEDGSATESADVRVVTFSDSALLTTNREYKLGDFYKLVRSLKTTIQNATSLKVYAIINRGQGISSPSMPALGCRTLDDNFISKYIAIAGSGNVWVDLWNGESTIKAQKKWHGKYSLYCIDDNSIEPGKKTQDSEVFTGLDNNRHSVLVIE